MAARVNTKFIVVVGIAVVALVAGVAFLGVQAIKKSGDDYVKLGDAAMEANKPGEAVGFYAKAVFKDQKNASWIRKWLVAMEKDVPVGKTAYMDTYDRQYKQALRALPEADPTDLDAHKKFLDETYDEIKTSLAQNSKDSMAYLEGMIKIADDLIANYKGDEAKGKVLLRYRAMPKVNLLVRNPNTKPAEYAAVKKDLEAVLAADPNDADAVLSIAQIDVSLAEQAKKRGEKEESDKLVSAAKERLRKFVTDHPPAAKVRLALLLQEAQLAASNADKPVTLAEVLQDRKQQVLDLVEAVKAEKPEDVEVGVADKTAQFATVILSPEAGRAAADSVMEHVLKGQPKNATLLMAIAGLDMLRNDTAKAELNLQKIVDMPTKPLSFEGKLLWQQKLMAILAQTDVVFTQWEASKDGNTRAELATKAKKYRDDLVSQIGEATPEVMSLDARLAFINGDRNGARTLLTRYNEQTGQRDARSMALLGELQLMQGSTGSAKSSFTRVLALDPRNVRALRLLGKIEQEAGNYEESQRYLRELSRLTPQDEALKTQVEQIDNILKNKDPVGRVLMEMEQKARGVGADMAAAIKIGEDFLKTKKDDLRVYAALVQLQLGREDRDAAVDVLNRAIVQFPADQRLKDTLKAMTEDPVPGRIKQIDESQATAADKAKAKYLTYSQAGEKYNTQSKAAYDEMVRLAPEDPFVVEYRFQAAAKVKDSKAMSEMVALAEAKNLDQLNGQLFRARQQFVEGKNAEAAISLRAAVERDKQNQTAWRILGQVQLNQRDAAGAIEAFGKAVEIRPNDIVSVNGLLRALIISGNLSEALAQAKKAESVAGPDPEFAELYVQLLTDAQGGDKQKAAEYRERMSKANPGDRMNQAQLALLKMEQRKFDEAKSSIDELRKDEKNKNIVTELDARWFALQGKFGDAEKVYDDYIAALPADKRGEEPYLAAARTFQLVGQPDRAIAFLDKGRSIEKKETMTISRETGDVYFNTGKAAEAAEAYRRVLDAGSEDREDAVAKRILECYQKQKDWVKFDALLASLGDKAQKDATLLVLAAEAAVQQGDDSRASKLYDQAVVADAKNPIVFMKRGDFAARDRTKEKDAIADYEQAVKLAPSSTVPLQRIALMHRSRGRFDRAAEAVRKALDIDPSDDAIRGELVNLRLRLRDEPGVTALLDEAIKLKPESVAWLMRAGSVMSEMGRVSESADYYGRAWDKKKALEVAVPYVTALLAKTPPDPAQAWRVASSKELDPADEVPSRLLKAMVLQRSDRKDEAYAEIEKAYLKVKGDDPQQVQLLAAGIESTYPDDNRSQLAVWEKLDKKLKLKGWFYIQASRPRLLDKETQNAAAAAVEAFVEGETDVSLKLSTYRMMANYYYSITKFDRAAAMYRKFLELQPDDAETLNNLAYTLATELKQPGEALKYAEKAVELAPNSPNALDTLGMVQFGLKNLDETIKTLSKALAKSQADNDKAPALIHIAKAYHAKGMKSEAKEAALRAREILNNNPAIRQQYEKELKEVTDQLDAQ